MRKTSISLVLILVLVFSSMIVPAYAEDDMMVPAYVEDGTLVSDYAEEPCPNWVEVRWGPVYCYIWATCITFTGYVYDVIEKDTCSGIEMPRTRLSNCAICIP